MRTSSICKLAALAVAMFAVSPVMAGGFNVWTYEASKAETQLVVSFAGDGVTQDAQLDLGVAKGFAAAAAKVLVPGSVCAISPAGDKIRAVPPSGAGKALSSSDVDYCSFSVKPVGGMRPMLKSGELLSVEFNECAGAGKASCSSDITDLSERGGRGPAAREFEK